MTPAVRPERRRRSLRRRGAPLFTFVGWLLLGATVAVGRFLGHDSAPVETPMTPPVVAPAESLATTDSVAPVEPVHPPVRVVATPPPAPKRSVPAPLPKPFAAMHTFASPLIMPRLSLPRTLVPHFKELSSLLTRARPGEPVSVTLSAYCLQGATRRGGPARPGIIAADPRIFPLARHVELFAGGRFLGRFLVDDTGKRIRGARIDIWTPDCDDARRFGMRSGVATLVAIGER